MVMKLSNPLVIQFQQGNGPVTRENNIVGVPTGADWNSFKNIIGNALNNDQIDYVALSYTDVGEDLQKDNVLKTLDIKTHQILKESTKKGLRAFTRFEDQVYFLNPTYDEQKNTSKSFYAKDDVVLAKRDRYTTDAEWEKHQSDILKKFKVMMPLTENKYFEKTNHKADLLDPSRGLHEDQLDEYFSWQPNKPIVPGLMGDNMIGMPGVKAAAYPDIALAVGDRDVPTTPLALETTGMPGIMIPMKNPQGDSPKYQIASDVTAYNVLLKARANDGVSIQKSEYFDKKTKEYNFKMNGDASHLKVSAADNKEITLQDTDGTFKVKLKQDVKPVLEARGYEIPEIIDSLKPVTGAKYIWMSPGNMVGSPKINNNKKEGMNRISPSNAGFITAREPKNGSDEYLVTVVEGALKGMITAEYIDKKDANGQSVADHIAKDRGLIIAQVPGVSKSFIESVDRIYDEKNIVGTYIAMDADGRENRMVAKGIHAAYDELSQYSPVKVLSWDPDQKGMDDALLAIARHEITVGDMDLHFGKAETLFPIEQSEMPNPYKMDGTRANGDSEWQKDWEARKKERNAKVFEGQKQSEDVDVKLENKQLSLDMDDLDDEKAMTK